MENYSEKAIDLVRNYIKSINVYPVRQEFDVRITWFCKTLQNWKAMVVTDLPDDVFYEITYDGNLKRAYIDAYQKVDNVCVPDEGVPSPTVTIAPNPKYNVVVNGEPIDPNRPRGYQIGDNNVQHNYHRGY